MADGLGNAMLGRCTFTGDLLEFAQRPFVTPEERGDSHGLAWMDCELLVPDAAHKRISAVERT